MSSALLTQVGIGNTSPLLINSYVNDSFLVGLIANLVSGSATFSVQITGDPTPTANGNWVEHDVITFQTASIASNIGYPITGIRLRNHSGTGTVTLGVVRWP